MHPPGAHNGKTAGFRKTCRFCHYMERSDAAWLRCSLAMTRNWNGFVWKTDVFHFCGYFLRSVAPHRLSNVSFRKLLRFSAKPSKFVIARRAPAPDAAIFNETICYPGTNYDRAERNRTLKERGSKTKQRISFFCDREPLIQSQERSAREALIKSQERSTRDFVPD